MTTGIAILVGLALLGVYLFMLGGNVLAAAISYTSRTRRREFPLGRCVVAATGPTAVPLVLRVVLPLWGYSNDAVSLAFLLAWVISFWGSAQAERKLPGSRPAEDDGVGAGREPPRGDPVATLTPAQSYLIWLMMILGVAKAWLALALGVAAGYGVAALASGLFGRPFRPPSWDRIAEEGTLLVLVFYAMAGFLIEVIRFQSRPGDVPGLAGWSSARGLRFCLLSCLGVAAIGIGFYAGLSW